MTVELNESNFHQQIDNSDGVTVVDFFTTWCGPCRMLAPILEQLSGARVVKVDGDKSPDLVVENKVNAYPTIVFFKNGKEVRREVGVHSQQKLQGIIDGLV